MITTAQAQQLVTGRGRVVTTTGDKIGDIGQVFLDDQTEQPGWVTVRTGLFGGAESFVPLRDAEVQGDDVRVPYDKATVKDAPRISDSEGHLSEDEEATLFAHYDVTDGDTDRDTDRVGDLTGDTAVDHTASDHTGTEATQPAAGHDVTGPDTDSAITRSEEQLHVGTRSRETGRARLRKFVVTEQVTTTVPVSHEEVRLEREPITEDNVAAATSGGELTSEEHEVVLHEERPVVEKETVPVERVRLGTDTVTAEEQVSEEVRKEQVELDETPAGPSGTETQGDERG